MTRTTTQTKEDITIIETPTTITVEGETFDHKKKLSAKDFKWLPRSMVWTRPLNSWEAKEHGRAMKSTKQSLEIGWSFMSGWSESDEE